MHSLYHRLNIDVTASQNDVRRAYHRLALQYHPDRNQGDKEAEAKFKALVSAFEILGDQQARALYDQGRIDENGRPRRGSQAEHRVKPAKKPRWMWTNAAEAFHNEYVKPNAGGRAGKDKQAPVSESNEETLGADETLGNNEAMKQYRLSVSFVEAALGTVKHVRLPNRQQYKITVPAGVISGQKLRVKSQSETMNPFMVKITIEPHIAFEREGHDIYLEVPLTPYEAYFGTELDIPTVHGPAKITIPAGAREGDEIILSNMGIRAKGQETGDQVALITIAMPRAWEANAKDVMKAWQQKAPYNPRGKILNLLTR